MVYPSRTQGILLTAVAAAVGHGEKRRCLSWQVFRDSGWDRNQSDLGNLSSDFVMDGRRQLARDDHWLAAHVQFTGETFALCMTPPYRAMSVLSIALNASTDCGYALAPMPSIFA